MLINKRLKYKSFTRKTNLQWPKRKYGSLLVEKFIVLHFATTKNVGMVNNAVPILQCVGKCVSQNTLDAIFMHNHENVYHYKHYKLNP